MKLSFTGMERMTEAGLTGWVQPVCFRPVNSEMLLHIQAWKSSGQLDIPV